MQAVQDLLLSIPTWVWALLGAVVISYIFVRWRLGAMDKIQAKPELAKDSVIELRASETKRPEPEQKPALSKTKHFFQQTFDKVFAGSEAAKFFDDLEEALIVADVGVDLSETLVRDLRSQFGVKMPSTTEMRSKLSDLMISRFPDAKTKTGANPEIIMIVGVNGAGKTTTIAKLCQRLRSEDKKVLVGAADTFRAAATEQLQTWIERVGAEGVFQKQGADPGAVAFDAVAAAKSRGSDYCIIDTAGRLHTKSNLMDELKKMKRTIAKAYGNEEAPQHTWLVLDGTTGQNALNQAREFHQALNLTGIIVTKLDGSAKGGAVLAIASELKVPVVFIGIGESPEDLVPFSAPKFVGAILGENALQ